MRSARYSASGVALKPLGHALRRHHLHDVAVENVAFGALDRRVISLLAEARHRRLRRPRRRVGRNRHRRAQAFSSSAEPASGRADKRRLAPARHTPPAKACPTGCRRSRVPPTAAAGCRARRADRAFARGKLFLDVAHRVVAEIADQPAAEARQARAAAAFEARLRYCWMNCSGSSARVRLFSLPRSNSLHSLPRTSRRDSAASPMNE